MTGQYTGYIFELKGQDAAVFIEGDPVKGMASCSIGDYSPLINVCMWWGELGNWGLKKLCMYL